MIYDSMLTDSLLFPVTFDYKALLMFLKRKMKKNLQLVGMESMLSSASCATVFG